MIAVVVLTHNRLHLLRQCVENVLLRTSDLTTEIVIWDNASTDGTGEYLASIEDHRFRVVRSDRNVGFNGYARGFALTTAPFMVELDDDVVDAPAGWDAMLRDGMDALPDVGYLAADLIDDPNDRASSVRHRVRPHEYTVVDENGVRVLIGPVGGGMAMTRRAIADRVGGWKERPGDVFWLEDEQYIKDVAKLGYRAVGLADLTVHHTGGSYYGAESREKQRFWRSYERRRIARSTVKRVILALPGGRSLVRRRAASRE
jgi:GT2 family glycosyltransferase